MDSFSRLRAGTGMVDRNAASGLRFRSCPDSFRTSKSSALTPRRKRNQRAPKVWRMY